MSALKHLQKIREKMGAATTTGLDDATVEHFLKKDESLQRAIEDAYRAYEALSSEDIALLSQDEPTAIKAIQTSYLNFYNDDALNPYVALAARGPWIVTSKGAVIHDSGGYGMLGFGHAPDFVLEVMARPQVMANVMTANLSQLKFAKALRKELGHKRGHCPFEKFLCLNSGSESVTLAARMADINAKKVRDQLGKPDLVIKRISLQGAFHGRTDRPARFSHSTLKTYSQHLASFENDHNLMTVAPNDEVGLQNAFDQAEKHGWFIEAMFIEPVMGEGNPGLGVTRSFYDLARRLTLAHNSLLLVDSIQAGLRAHGCLSIIDYPGFEDAVAPDMETYSKALNAGHYPLSVLALNERAAKLYARGVYGNTMTSNPRALEVAEMVLSRVTDSLRANIEEKGKYFVDQLEALAKELPGLITKVQGTGLLVSCELEPSLFKCFGSHSTEEYLRYRGIGVIHGGKNSLRFTPHFAISAEEIDLVIGQLKLALINGPRLATTAAANDGHTVQAASR